MADNNLLQITSECCTGCMLCKLACSIAKTKKFSYSRARIDVQRVGNVERYRISLKPDCDGCAYCVRYCAFDALAHPAHPKRARKPEPGISAAYVG